MKLTGQCNPSPVWGKSISRGKDVSANTTRKGARLDGMVNINELLINFVKTVSQMC